MSDHTFKIALGTLVVLFLVACTVTIVSTSMMVAWAMWRDRQKARRYVYVRQLGPHIVSRFTDPRSLLGGLRGFIRDNGAKCLGYGWEGDEFCIHWARKGGRI